VIFPDKNPSYSRRGGTWAGASGAPIEIETTKRRRINLFIGWETAKSLFNYREQVDDKMKLLTKS
jgi:hypothetical protein